MDAMIMTRFMENHIDLRLPREGTIRTTLSELHYYSRVHNALVAIPVGFETDLGSIPQVLQAIFPKDGKAVLAYILHDYLYKTGKYTRSQTDDILEEAMKGLGVGWGTRFSVREGLRVGGWIAWDQQREKDNK